MHKTQPQFKIISYICTKLIDTGGFQVIVSIFKHYQLSTINYKNALFIPSKIHTHTLWVQSFEPKVSNYFLNL